MHFCLMVLESSVCSQLALLLWVCGVSEHHGGRRLWWSKVLILWQSESRERKGVCVREGRSESR